MPELNEAELAARYGFAMAVLNANPELRGLFNRAVAETYTPERFQAELRNTQFYKLHSETLRRTSVQKVSDRASYDAAVEQMRSRIGMLASELGASMTPTVLFQMAESAYAYGWDDNQVRAQMDQYVQYTDGRLIGQAGQWETELRDWASQNGVTLSDGYYREHIASAVAGRQTVNDVKKAITNMAASAYPHLADRLRAGETVATIADPYRQTMATLLEVNPESVTVSDPTIKAALQSKDDKGAPVLRTLYDFENDLRKDKRWLKTKNAQDAAMNTTNRVLRDMGLVS